MRMEAYMKWTFPNISQTNMQIGNSDLAFLPEVTALMMNSEHNGPCWTPTAEGIILSTLEKPTTRRVWKMLSVGELE